MANTLFPKKISWGEKERSNLSSDYLDQRRINFIWIYFIWAKDGLYLIRAYDPFLIVYYNLLLAGLTRQVLAQYI